MSGAERVACAARPLLTSTSVESQSPEGDNMIRSLMILAAFSAVACSQGSKDKTTPKPNQRELKIKAADPAACQGASPANIDGTWQAITATEDGTATGKQLLNFKNSVITSTSVCTAGAKTLNLSVSAPVKIGATSFTVLAGDQKAELLTPDTPCVATLQGVEIVYKFAGKCLMLIGQQGLPDVVLTPVP